MGMGGRLMKTIEAQLFKEQNTKVKEILDFIQEQIDGQYLKPLFTKRDEEVKNLLVFKLKNMKKIIELRWLREEDN
jgi:hypothetical protein